jgi:hypothetical protein
MGCLQEYAKDICHYAADHKGNDPLRRASEAIAGRISAALQGTRYSVSALALIAKIGATARLAAEVLGLIWRAAAWGCPSILVSSPGLAFVGVLLPN